MKTHRDIWSWSVLGMDDKAPAHQYWTILTALCTQQVLPKLIFLMETNLKYNLFLRKYDLIIQVSVAIEKLQEYINIFQQQGLDCPIWLMP